MAAMTNKELTNVGWQIPVAVRDRFTAFSDRVGNKIQEDCAGALIVWLYLPAQLREWARLEAKGCSAVGEGFWEGFAEGLAAELQRLGNSQQIEKDK